MNEEDRERRTNQRKPYLGSATSTILFLLYYYYRVYRDEDMATATTATTTTTTTATVRSRRANGRHCFVYKHARGIARRDTGFVVGAAVCRYDGPRAACFVC